MKPRRGRRVDATGRSIGDGHHARLYRWLHRSAAWQHLGAGGRALYIELKMLYTGQNNGELFMSVREAAPSGSTAARPMPPNASASWRATASSAPSWWANTSGPTPSTSRVGQPVEARPRHGYSLNIRSAMRRAPVAATFLAWRLSPQQAAEEAAKKVRRSASRAKCPRRGTPRLKVIESVRHVGHLRAIPEVSRSATKHTDNIPGGVALAIDSIMEASKPVTLPTQVNNNSAALAHYDAACKALAEARAVDEVQGIRAEAEAVRAYAKQAKNRQMELDAAEIRIRAERRLGELMAAQGETVGRATGAKGIGTSAGYDATRTLEAPPTLDEAGIDKNLAHRARTYAAVPEAKFEKLLKDKRRRDSVRVVLDPDFQAEAEASARDLEMERDERIALGDTAGLVAENESLRKQVAALDRRIAALVEENGSLKARASVWQQRAITAGWKKGHADA